MTRNWRGARTCFKQGRHTPKERYRPYIISGQAVGEGDNIVLKSIDTCAPKAPNFGVPEKNVFK